MGIHIGQQHMPIDEMRALRRRRDGVLDRISVWDHLDEATPAGGNRDAGADLIDITIRAPIDHDALGAFTETVAAVRRS